MGPGSSPPSSRHPPPPGQRPPLSHGTAAPVGSGSHGGIGGPWQRVLEVTLGTWVVGAGGQGKGSPRFLSSGNPLPIPDRPRCPLPARGSRCRGPAAAPGPHSGSLGAVGVWEASPDPLLPTAQRPGSCREPQSTRVRFPTPPHQRVSPRATSSDRRDASGGCSEGSSPPSHCQVTKTTTD